MAGSKDQTRANMLRSTITVGLSLLVVISMGVAAYNLDIEGLSFVWNPVAGAAAIACFTLLPVSETLRLAALARFERSGGLRAWGINAAAMALVQAPFGLVGAEAYRANAYVRRGETLSSTLAAILIARALGFASMLVLMAIAAGFLAQSLPPLVKTASASAAVIGFAAIILGPLALRRWPPAYVPARLTSFVAALSQMALPQILAAVLWSASVVIFRAMALWLCAATFGVTLPIAFAVFASAAGLFIALIPFASGIVGVREGGIAGVLVLAGVPLAAGLLIGFAMRLGAVIGALIGMVCGRFFSLRQTP